MQTFGSVGRLACGRAEGREMCDRHALVCGLAGIIDKVVVRCAREKARGARTIARPRQKHFGRNVGLKWNLLVSESAVDSHDVGDYSKCKLLERFMAFPPLPFSICSNVDKVAKVAPKAFCVPALKLKFKEISNLGVKYFYLIGPFKDKCVSCIINSKRWEFSFSYCNNI